ncbi:hypothetical protein, conserved [Leishmania tarentolae]|uniref:Uncharacterized protein n=1 Tax=Leishmania tarentolae TaxID=5689 RepID=A0A640KK13_LEITA|nr:hypothetical protein, conserved [Leishmania tarentolae]
MGPHLNSNRLLVHSAALVANAHNVTRALPFAGVTTNGLPKHDRDNVRHCIAALRLRLAENGEAHATWEALKLWLNFVTREDEVVVVRQQCDGWKRVDGAVHFLNCGDVAKLLGLMLVLIALRGRDVKHKPLVLERVQRIRGRALPRAVAIFHDGGKMCSFIWRYVRIMWSTFPRQRIAVTAMHTGQRVKEAGSSAVVILSICTVCLCERGYMCECLCVGVSLASKGDTMNKSKRTNHTANAMNTADKRTHTHTHTRVLVTSSAWRRPRGKYT